MWDAPFVEFYYPALSDETHVTVDINNAAEKFSALRNDHQRQQKLLANAERVSQELLCPNCLGVLLAETDKKVPVLLSLGRGAGRSGDVAAVAGGSGRLEVEIGGIGRLDEVEARLAELPH